MQIIKNNLNFIDGVRVHKSFMKMYLILRYKALLHFQLPSAGFNWNESIHVLRSRDSRWIRGMLQPAQGFHFSLCVHFQVLKLFAALRICEKREIFHLQLVPTHCIQWKQNRKITIMYKMVQYLKIILRALVVRHQTAWFCTCKTHDPLCLSNHKRTVSPFLLFLFSPQMYFHCLPDYWGTCLPQCPYILKMTLS